MLYVYTYKTTLWVFENLKFRKETRNKRQNRNLTSRSFWVKNEMKNCNVKLKEIFFWKNTHPQFFSSLSPCLAISSSFNFDFSSWKLIYFFHTNIIFFWKISGPKISLVLGLYLVYNIHISMYIFSFSLNFNFKTLFFLNKMNFFKEENKK